MADKKDWFKVYRSLLTDKMWLEEPFTKGQAWVDLIGRANYGTTEHISGPHCNRYYRGQLPTSIVALSDRWKWSRRKVENFLNALVEAQMISTKSTSKGTTITIENYDKFQGQGETEKHQKSIEEASKEHQSDYTKRINKEETKNTQEYGGVTSSQKEPSEEAQEPICNSPTLARLVKEWGVNYGPAVLGGKNEAGTN